LRQARKQLRPDGEWSKKTSDRVDNLVGILFPKAALRRKAYRFGYEALDKHRTRKKRTGLGGKGDTHLTRDNLYNLREVSRELMRNNPLAKRLLKVEQNGIIGSGVKIQARTDDDGLDKELESAWKEEMLDKPCDVTGRLNFNQYVRKYFLAYRRDGDAATIFLDDELQAIEGEQIGTPVGRKKEMAKNFEVVNGIAYSKKTKKVVGYYIGEASDYGFIKSGSYEKYLADHVHLMFDPERFSQSRGEPILTSSVKLIDILCDYIDAELVAAKVNACFSMFIKSEYPDIPAAYTKGISSSGLDEDDEPLEKMEPGIIMYGKPGEEAQGIGQTRPASQFDPFILRILSLIGGPLSMPLMLVTQDFSGATFMNARLAYQKVQEEWQAQQDNIVKPFVSRVWRWKLGRLLDTKRLKVNSNDKIFRHEILCRRWPYVDPFKEAKADEQQLLNGTISRTEICARMGRDFTDVTDELERESKYRSRKDLPQKSAPVKKGD